MAIDNLYRAIEELMAGGKGVIGGTTTGSGTKFHFTSVDPIRDGTLIFTVFPAAPSAAAKLYINDEEEETSPLNLKVDNENITATSIKNGAAVLLYVTGEDVLVVNPKSVYSKTDVGLGNVDNESKETMFTDPAFTGIPTAPTAADGTSTSQVATTEFVDNAIEDAKVDTDLSGVPTAPTAEVGTNTTQLATTAFVNSAIDGRIITDTVFLDGVDGEWVLVDEVPNYILDNADVKATSIIICTAAHTATPEQIVEYAERDIKCVGQAAGELTFTCNNMDEGIETIPILLIIIEPR